MKASSPAQVQSAFAACRSICFAVENAARYGGEFSLNDILAADRLAREALRESPAAKSKRQRKKGGAS